MGGAGSFGDGGGGGGAPAVIGWDMSAAFALATALGIPALAVAELLPEIEAVMVRRMNEQIAAGA